jgi:exodeoxyribonuclease VII large subunit
MEERLTRSRQKVLRLSPIHGLNRYHDRLKREHMKVLHDRDRMLHAMTKLLTRAQHNWLQNSQQLQALNPQNVLARGFSILRKSDGKIVCSKTEVANGDVLEGILYDGRIKLVVVQTEATQLDVDGPSASAQPDTT